MAIGYCLVHPLAMWAYTLGPQHGPLPRDLAFWGRELLLAFSPGMIHMGVAFALMGGVAGLSLGAWHLQKERLVAEKLESQRRLVALETLGELMVTLAHHIRNANMVVGGFSTRLQKHLSEPEIKNQLEMIQRASREIEAVINSLESLTEINHLQYVSAWETKMIDLNKELKARLDAGLTKRGQT